MSESVAVPTAFLVQLCEAVDASFHCTPGLTRHHLIPASRCAGLMLRILGHPERILDRSDPEQERWDQLHRLGAVSSSLEQEVEHRTGSTDVTFPVIIQIAVEQTLARWAGNDPGDYPVERLAKAAEEAERLEDLDLSDVDLELLPQLAGELEALADILERDEPEDDSFEPHLWRGSEPARESASLLRGLLEGHGLPDDWRRYWPVCTRLRLMPAPPEIEASNILTRDEVEATLDDPPQPYYVYLLHNKTGRVFYVGKGTGKRIFSHEREVYKPAGKFTNWKKLNRIAQLLKSGVGVRYSIDSWHLTEESALKREDELIILYENYDYRYLCNSKGRRGSPSKGLRALWADGASS
jgi:hypothetical protein